MASTSPSSLRILTLDGGGIRGLTSLLILQRIMRTLKELAGLDKDPRPCEIFDLIVGTSTGGLIAVMLGRLGMTIEEAIQQYQTVGRQVFGPSVGGKPGILIKGLVGSPLYNIETLQSSIREIAANRDPPISPDTSFCEKEDQRCKVMLSVTRQITAKADTLRSYPTKQSTQENYDCTIWEAASATSAAPIYFKRVQFRK